MTDLIWAVAIIMVAFPLSHWVGEKTHDIFAAVATGYVVLFGGMLLNLWFNS